MSRRVLVVEPSRIIRKLLEIYLQRDGHQTMIFASYGEARYALTLPPFRTDPPEMIFLAIHTSQPESYRLIEALKRLYTHTFTKIIVMVAQEERDHHLIRRLVPDEQIVLLIKPFRIQDALALVSPSQYIFPDAVETS